MFKHAFIAITLLSSSNVLAGKWITDEQPADTIEMGGVNMGYPKGLYFVKPSGYENPDNCINNKFVQFTEEFLIDRVLSSALYAQSIGKKLRFYIDGCNGNYIQAHAFQVID